MNARRTSGPTPVPTSAPRRARRASWIAAATAGLLLATPALAQGGAWSPGGGGAMGDAPTRPMVGMRSGGGMRPDLGRGGAMRFGGAGPRAALPELLQRLPLGTEVSVALHDGDPAEGAEATDRRTAVVGETSEVAFAQELADAAQGATFAVVEVGPRVQRVELADADGRAPLARLARALDRLDLGATVEVALYADAGDTSPSSTLSFTLGQDSEAAFRAELADAAADAAVAEIALPAQERTIELGARPFTGARGGVGPGPGMRMPGRAR